MRWRTAVLTRLALGCAWLSLLFAQTYQPGELVVFDYYGDEKVGRVVRQDSSGVLILHREADGTFNERTGAQAYFPLAKVKRRLGERGARSRGT
jgi:hypothetical protein